MKIVQYFVGLSSCALCIRSVFQGISTMIITMKEQYKLKFHWYTLLQ